MKTGEVTLEQRGAYWNKRYRRKEKVVSLGSTSFKVQKVRNMLPLGKNPSE